MLCICFVYSSGNKITTTTPTVAPYTQSLSCPMWLFLLVTSIYQCPLWVQLDLYYREVDSSRDLGVHLCQEFGCAMLGHTCSSALWTHFLTQQAVRSVFIKSSDVLCETWDLSGCIALWNLYSRCCTGPAVVSLDKCMKSMLGNSYHGNDSPDIGPIFLRCHTGSWAYVPAYDVSFMWLH